MRPSKKLISLLLTALMLISCCAAAVPTGAAETGEDDFQVVKISNPDRGEREVDGLIEGGDRENSYTWRMAMRGDEIYIATTRNIASALVNMYGGEFAKAGIDIDTFWAMIDVVTNGDIPRNDANEGANIISYNRTTGEFKVIYTADSGDYFRMAVTFGDDVYFGSYSANPANEQYILKLDEEGNFTKVFRTMGSVSLRANCVYDDHLFFAGADDRTPVPEGSAAPVAKMAVLRKSNEDDTVWERVADYRDFGTTAYDPIHASWAGAPIWELANHDGYIYATAPTHAGFVIYKGRPAEDGEEANEYGWIWTEVAGKTNGINNPGLSEIEGGEPGTMRSLIGSVYEYNGELYAYNFDHSFGGEASAFAGALQQIAGQDVKASDYLFYLYDSLHNPQKVWKLNDVTGEFEELEEFTKLMEGTTNEYIWRLGEHEGDLYIATMDAGIFYNYLTQLTNGSFCNMSKEEIAQKICYVKKLISLIAESKAGEAAEALQAKLEQLCALLESLQDPDAGYDASVYASLAQYDDADQLIAELTVEFEAWIGQSTASEMLGDKDDLAATGANDEDPSAEEGGIFSLLGSKLEELRLKIAVALQKIEEFKQQIEALKDSIDWKGMEMYAYINRAVMSDHWGFDLYRTNDGVNFRCITDNGFNDKYNYGCPSFLSAEEGLYIGTCNPFYGGQLYLLTNESGAQYDQDTGYSITGSITSFIDPEGIVRVELRSLDSEEECSMETQDAYYDFYDLVPGDYILTVSKDDHVPRDYSVTITDEDVVLDVEIHPIGDINGDGDVTTADVMQANSHAKQKKLITDAYKFKCADVMGNDDSITTADVVRLNAHAKKKRTLWTKQAMADE